MTLYSIKHYANENILFESECISLKQCVEQAVCQKVDLREANLSGADLRGADLRGADLSEADLTRADLHGAYLHGAYLSEGDLSRANLREANLTRANLYKANLSGANLSRANLRGAGLATIHIIDGGQDKRGWRFWAWRHKGGVVYRAGCREWNSIGVARSHYTNKYKGDGNVLECLARLDLMHSLAAKWR